MCSNCPILPRLRQCHTAPGLGRKLALMLVGAEVRSWPTSAYRRPTVHISLTSLCGRPPGCPEAAGTDPKRTSTSGTGSAAVLPKADTRWVSQADPGSEFDQCDAWYPPLSVTHGAAAPDLAPTNWYSAEQRRPVAAPSGWRLRLAAQWPRLSTRSIFNGWRPSTMRVDATGYANGECLPLSFSCDRKLCL